MVWKAMSDAIRKRQAERSPEERSAIARKIYASRRSNKTKFEDSLRRMGASRKARWEDPESRATVIEGMKRTWQDKDSREHRLKILHTISAPKISRTMRGKCPVGRPRGGRVVWYDGVNGRIRMRSNSEVRYAKLLDDQNVEWMYEQFTFAVGNRETWTPDFYLPKEKRFVEIKGWLLPIVKRKIEKVIGHFSATRFEVLDCHKFQTMLAA